MRCLVNNAITKKEAQNILAMDRPSSKKSLKNPIPIIERLINLAEQTSGSTVDNDCEKNYWRVECKASGHDWHYDTGSRLQMLWCGLSLSVLLTDPRVFEGGKVNFKYKDGSIESYRDNHYLNALIYSSISNDKTNMHQVEPHSRGKREVLLIFMGLQGMAT